MLPNKLSKTPAPSGSSMSDGLFAPFRSLPLSPTSESKVDAGPKTPSQRPQLGPLDESSTSHQRLSAALSWIGLGSTQHSDSA